MALRLTQAQLQEHVAAILQEQQEQGVQLEDLTPKTVRFQLEERMNLAQDELKPLKDGISAAIKAALAAQPVKTEAAASFSSLAPSASASSKLAAQQQLNANKKRALSAAAGDNSDDEPAAAAGAGSGKKPRMDDSSSSSSSGGNPNVVQLGSSKRVEVSKFKGMVLIDIREMYTNKTSGEEMPGKKGIALKVEQWETLMKHAGKINAAIEKMGSK